MLLIKPTYLIVLFGLLLLNWPTLGVTQVRKATPVTILNSDSDELMPVMAPDGKKIYFVRSNHPENMGGKTAGQDIWFSARHKVTNEWQEPQNMGPPLNNIYNNAISGFSPSGDRIWLSNVYLTRNRMAPGLSFATPTATGWTKPEAVNIKNFFPETGFINFFQATDSILLLSMQTDTAHLEDIYVCHLLGPKEWSEPVSLGAPINSRGFEIAPFLAPDGKTLYFASNGHGGFGDADIFMSRRLDNSWLRWSEPVNLGASVNTAGFEGYFTLDATGEQAYFTSEDDVKADTDIYSIRLDAILPPESKTKSPLAVASPLAKEVNTEIVKTQPAFPVLIYFDVNSAVINPTGQAILQQLFLQLLPIKNKSLLITGHADDTGTEKINKNLATRRAQAVANFLRLQGLPKENMRVQGRGSTQPAAPNATAENRAKNRRVEIQVE